MKKFIVCMMAAAPFLNAAGVEPSPAVARLYRARCGACHGTTGEGGVGPSFKGKLAHPTPKAMFSVVKNGIPGTAMPACSLPDAEIRKLVTYVGWIRKQPK
jgi:mono/diheme cytochrome c family protein